jgi:hypothetical protein
VFPVLRGGGGGKDKVLPLSEGKDAEGRNPHTEEGFLWKG